MITVRKSGDRGHFDHGWLDTRHTFSFARYRDPDHMGFRDLRVINEDVIRPGGGFGTHPHRDMEIISYVVSGALEHRDSMGNGAVLRPGEVQAMSAGRGITHSEFNPSDTEPGHFLQIWILPREKGADPVWDQKAFPADERRGRLRPVASPDGREGSLRVGQDVTVYASLLPAGASLRHDLTPGRHGWVQVVRGAVDLNGTALAVGDGAAVSDETRLALAATGDSELLVFDLR